MRRKLHLEKEEPGEEREWKQRRVSWDRERDTVTTIESCRQQPLWHHQLGSKVWCDGCEQRVETGRLHGEEGTSRFARGTFLCPECGFERTALRYGALRELVQRRRCAKKRRQEIPREEWRGDLTLIQTYKQMQDITRWRRQNSDEPLSQRGVAARRQRCVGEGGSQEEMSERGS